jgi:hypothetical protein
MKLCLINENTLVKGLRWLESAVKELPKEVNVYWNNVGNEVRLVVNDREEIKRIIHLKPIFKVLRNTNVTFSTTHPFGPPWIMVNR